MNKDNKDNKNEDKESSSEISEEILEKWINIKLYNIKLFFKRIL